MTLVVLLLVLSLAIVSWNYWNVRGSWLAWKGLTPMLERLAELTADVRHDPLDRSRNPLLAYRAFAERLLSDGDRKALTDISHTVTDVSMLFRHAFDEFGDSVEYMEETRKALNRLEEQVQAFRDGRDAAPVQFGHFGARRAKKVGDLALIIRALGSQDSRLADEYWAMRMRVLLLAVGITSENEVKAFFDRYPTTFEPQRLRQLRQEWTRLVNATDDSTDASTDSTPVAPIEAS